MKRMITVISGLVLAALITINGMAMGAQKANPIGSIKVQNKKVGFAKMAKISFDSAVNAALQAVPGQVLGAELENENGYLVYGVEILKSDHQIADVKVDAGNGKILKIDTEQNENDDHNHEEYSDNDHEEGGER